MITPLKIFEAYIGQTVEEFIVKGEMLSEYLVEDMISGIKNEDVDSEDIDCVGDIKEVDACCNIIEATHQAAIDLAFKYLSNLTEEMNLQEILYEFMFWTQSRANSYEMNKMDESLKVARALIIFAETETLNENHLLMAKKDKETFKVLILSQFK